MCYKVGIMEDMKSIIRFFVLFVVFLFQYAHSREKNIARAELIFKSISYELPFPSIIEENEWHELQLDRLCVLLDRTKTSCGSWALKQLLHPVADYQELIRRQDIIKFLVKHNDFLFSLQQDLQIMAETEKAVFAYWSKSDELHRQCEQFYYSFSVFRYLNNSNLALNYGVISQMIYSFKALLQSLCMDGIREEISSWLYGQQEECDLYRGLMNGLQYPLNQHSLLLDTCDSD